MTTTAKFKIGALALHSSNVTKAANNTPMRRCGFISLIKSGDVYTPQGWPFYLLVDVSCRYSLLPRKHDEQRVEYSPISRRLLCAMGVLLGNIKASPSKAGPPHSSFPPRSKRFVSIKLRNLISIEIRWQSL